MNANSKRKALRSNQTIGDWLKLATAELQSAGVTTARLDTELILARHLQKARTWLISHSDDSLESDQQLERILQRRIAREPLAYIFGHKEFYGRDFLVNSDVLIPRPESETIIELLKELTPEPRLLIDVGTGSGALAVTAALELNPASVIATDISPEALAIARQNANRLQASIKFIESHLLDNLSDMRPDVIIANLPYVDAKWQRSPETDYEPALALFAAQQGIELIIDCIKQAARQLVTSGYLLLEADLTQHDEIISRGNANGFSKVTVRDYVVVLQYGRTPT